MATTMKVELINPFVTSTINVFRTMFATELKRGQVFLRRPDQTHGGLSGVIGLSGQAQGTAAVIVSEETAMRVTSRFLGMDVDAVNDDVVDCIGEVINMVAGGAKAQMESYALSLSLPSIVRGKDHLIEFPSNITPICIPFGSDIGDLMVQIGFIMND